MNWSPDWGLRARMLLTVGLLAGLYAVFIGVLLTVNAGLLTIILVMGLFMLGQLFFSDRLALYSMGARAVSEEEYEAWLDGAIETYAGVPRDREVASAE